MVRDRRSPTANHKLRLEEARVSSTTLISCWGSTLAPWLSRGLSDSSSCFCSPSPTLYPMGNFAPGGGVYRHVMQLNPCSFWHHPYMSYHYPASSVPQGHKHVSGHGAWTEDNEPKSSVEHLIAVRDRRSPAADHRKNKVEEARASSNSLILFWGSTLAPWLSRGLVHLSSLF